MYVFYISDQVLDLCNCTIVCSLCILNLHPPVSCLPSPQLTLPEDTQPRNGHTLTACKMEESRVHATTFGGCPSYDPKATDDSLPKLADTTVLEFGEQNTYHTTVACPFTLLYCGFNRALIDIHLHPIHFLIVCPASRLLVCVATDMQPPLLQCVLTVHQGPTDSVVASLH